MFANVFVDQLDRVDPHLSVAVGAIVGAAMVIVAVVRALQLVRAYGWYNWLRDMLLLLAVLFSACALGVVVFLCATGGFAPAGRAGPAPGPRGDAVTARETALTAATEEVADLPEEVTVAGIELVLVRPGRHTVGSPPSESGRAHDEGARRVVTLTRPFYLARTEVTQGQWQAPEDGKNPSYFAPGGEGHEQVAGLDAARLPVEQVSFAEARGFCARLRLPGQWSGWRFDLPTETEWECACRWGEPQAFHFGAALGADLANFDARWPYGGAPKGEYRGHPLPVGTFPANRGGLRDMHGNVAEWCRADGPRPPAEVGLEVVCGGSWCTPGVSCRAAARDWRDPAGRYSDVGFRIAFVPDRP
jgi:formylglycine-generating enzyme required for sulfatase activity